MWGVVRVLLGLALRLSEDLARRSDQHRQVRFHLDQNPSLRILARASTAVLWSRMPLSENPKALALLLRIAPSVVLEAASAPPTKNQTTWSD
jgi:hypothetical protein